MRYALLFPLMLSVSIAQAQSSFDKTLTDLREHIRSAYSFYDTGPETQFVAFDDPRLDSHYLDVMDRDGRESFSRYQPVITIPDVGHRIVTIREALLNDAQRTTDVAIAVKDAAEAEIVIARLKNTLPRHPRGGEFINEHSRMLWHTGKDNGLFSGGLPGQPDRWVIFRLKHDAADPNFGKLRREILQSLRNFSLRFVSSTLIWRDYMDGEGQAALRVPYLSRDKKVEEKNVFAESHSRFKALSEGHALSQFTVIGTAEPPRVNFTIVNATSGPLPQYAWALLQHKPGLDNHPVPELLVRVSALKVVALIDLVKGWARTEVVTPSQLSSEETMIWRKQPTSANDRYVRIRSREVRANGLGESDGRFAAESMIEFADKIGMKFVSHAHFMGGVLAEDAAWAFKCGAGLRETK